MPNGRLSGKVNEVAKQQGTEQAVDVDSLAGEAELELASRESFTGAEDEGADLTPLAVQSMGERKAIIEALIFVSDEPLSAKSIAEVLKEDQSVIEAGHSESGRGVQRTKQRLAVARGRRRLAVCHSSRVSRTRPRVFEMRSPAQSFRSLLSKRWQSSLTSSRSRCRRFWRSVGCNHRRQSRPCWTRN